ncbi:AMP-dependent synthetase/ligase [Nakamurella deserti]|uniref:AMP-dependent synthetase/ligase n=1 Tax=Nakamurella deserti TaxID=2164074 RepID=UPI000DBE2218|nr:long-chain fatty acid--CoA ligase [Nakamurella deserti]
MSNSTTTSGDPISQRQRSFGEMFADRVAESGTSDAFRYPEDGGWTTITWNQTRDRVYRIAAGLIDLGIAPEDRVAIAATTRIEWVLCDLAIMCAAAATTTIYPSTSAEDFAYITSDSGSRVLVAENPEQAGKILGHPDSAAGLLAVVLIDGAMDDDRTMTLAELEERGARRLAAEPRLVDDAIAGVGPEDLATLIYTSGTTGRPKGVRLVHDSWTYTARGAELLDFLRTDDVQYLWLPLSHVFGKVLLGVQLRIGFVTAVDGNVDKIVENLAVVRPTFMAGAPRVFEKVRAKVTATAQAEGGAKAKIFDWAIAVGIRYEAARAAGRPGPLLTAQHAVADTLVFSKVKHRLGGRIRFFVSGSAALSAPVAEWFRAVGMPILQGYGLTETSAASFVNEPRHNVLGTVGPVFPGSQVRIADDGEILIKGPGVMRGYHNMPEATAEVLDADGWFATGDIGELTEDGFLRVTDRKKDLIKTSGGKYIAPQKIEILFKAISPQVSHIIVHGEGRKYVSALITLDPDAIGDWAKSAGLEASYEKLATQPQLHQMIQQQIDDLNSKLERWETIKKFEILGKDLSVEDGELTPSMKVRRKAVEKEYKDLLDKMYTD